MGKKIATLILGTLFGFSLLYAAYLFFVLGLALGIATDNAILLLLSYLFWPLGLVAIIGSALAIKFTKATRIMLTIPLICFILTAIYSLVLLTFSPVYLITILLIFGLGFTATLLSYLTKKETKRPFNQTEDTLDKEATKIEETDANKSEDN